MPLVFTITKEDVLRSKVLAPGWYKAQVKKVEATTAGTDGSAGAVVSFSITQPGEFHGTPLDTRFWEKAPGFSVPFFRACGAAVTEAGGNFDFEKSVGREVLIYVQNRMYQNRLTNDIVDYKALAAN